jgi:hypothetical protein
MKHQFDPYDLLIELNERLSRLEVAHNKLARAYEQTEKDFSVLLTSHQHLQKAHLTLSELWAHQTLDKFTKNP